jgi:enoyl-CoA hydratase
MDSKTVLYQKMNGVGKITLNRPEADNAINVEVVDEIDRICYQISIDDSVRVVVLTGTGEKAFSAGTEKMLLNSYDCTGEVTLPSVSEAIAKLKCPVIAALNGDASGQGLELALACDIRISVDTASFSIPHITTGLIPWDGATQRLPRLVGMAAAMEMVLTGKNIDAEEALRIGLVNMLVPSEKLVSIVDEISQTIVSKSPFALNFIKEAINKGLDMTLEQGLNLEGDLYFLLQTTEDCSEGIKAFLGKRQPRFKGK